MRYLYLILNACKPAQLTLDYNTVIVCVFDYSLCQSDVLLKGQMRTVDHNRCEAAVNTTLAKLKRVAVVKMNAYRQVRLDNRRLDKLHKIGMVCILSCTARYLKDKRSLLFLCRFRNALDDLHIVDIESTYGIAALICLSEHLFTRY